MNADSSRLTRRKIQMQVEEQIINPNPSQPLIRNSQSNAHNPLSLHQPQHTHIQTYQQLPPTNRERRQEVFYLPLQKENFAVYCIATKESRLGIGKHERLLMVNGLNRQLQYYSHVPSLPLGSLQDITDSPKEYVHLPTASKFRFIVSLGEITVEYLQGGEMKEWKLTVGSSAVARELAEVVDQVRRKEKIRRVVKKVMEKEGKVNTKVTHFVQEIRLLEKGENKVEVEKREETAKSEVKEKKENTLLDVLVVEKAPSTKPFDMQTEKKPQQIKQQYDSAKSKKPQHLTINIDEITAEASQTPHHDPTPVLQTPSNPRKLSQIDRILQQRRELQEIDDLDSSRTIKSPKHHLSLSKRLVHKVQLTPTHRLQATPSRKQARKSIKIEEIVAQVHSQQKQNYQSERYPTADHNRNSLLQERRMTMASDRKKNILNQHSHPRVERSRSKSKDEQLPSNPNRRWLDKWIAANSPHQRGLLYCQFMEYCYDRVVKMTDGYSNWHLFHRLPQEYTLEENEVSWTYVMLGEKQSMDKERELQSKWVNWQYLWNFGTKCMVPLACVVHYIGLQVYCKAERSQNSKYFTEVEDLSTCFQQIEEIESKCGFMLSNIRLFKVNLPGKSGLYIEEGQCLLKLKENTNMMIDFGFIEYMKDTQISKINDIQFIMAKIKNECCSALLTNFKQKHPLSTLQLSDMLTSHGLNISLVPYLYTILHEKPQNNHATRWLASQIITQELLLIARQLIHKELLSKHSHFDITAVLLIAVNRALQWDEGMLKVISSRITDKTGVSFEEVQREMVEEYVISSLLVGLGVSCQIREEINLNEVQEIQYSFWKDFQFNKANVSIRFCPMYQIYSYPHFNPKYTSINEAFIAPTALNWQLFQSSINHNPTQHYSSSFLFQILPITMQLHLQQFLTGMNVPKATLKQLPHSPSHLIYADNHNLLCSFLYNKELIAIKQEIKSKHFQKALHKLIKLMIRLKIWGGQNHLQRLVKLYKIKSMVELLLKNYNEALSSSLKTLQLAISLYERGESNEMGILVNAHTAANLHFKLERYGQADDLFMTCEAVTDSLLQNGNALESIDPSFLQIYYKRLQLQLMVKSDQQGLALCNRNIQKYNQWKSLLPAGHPTLSIIDLQHFETSLLQLRFLQLLHQPQQYLLACNAISLQFLDSRIHSIDEDSINQFYYRFVEISKCVSYALPRGKQEGEFALEVSLIQQADVATLRKDLERGQLEEEMFAQEDAFSRLVTLLLGRSDRKSHAGRQKSELITFIAEAYGQGNSAMSTASSSLCLLSSLLGRSWLIYCLA